MICENLRLMATYRNIVCLDGADFSRIVFICIDLQRHYLFAEICILALKGGQSAPKSGGSWTEDMLTSTPWIVLQDRE